MENQLLDNEISGEQNNLKVKVRLTVLIALIIVSLFWCYYVFSLAPSIRYLMILYALFLIIVSATGSTILTKEKSHKLIVALVTFSSPLFTFLAAVFDTVFLNSVRIGQPITAVFAFFNLLLILYVWGRKN